MVFEDLVFASVGNGTEITYAASDTILLENVWVADPSTLDISFA